MKNIVNAPVGAAHIIEDLNEIVEYKVKKKTKIILNLSIQINGNPHIGTLFYLSSAFSYAKKLKKKYSNVVIQFHVLDNVNIAIKDRDNECSNYKSIEIKYKDEFLNLKKRIIQILEYLKLNNNVDYILKDYSYIQKQKRIRKEIINIFNKYDEFSILLNPKNKKINLRINCPICNCSDKSGKNFRFELIKEGVLLQDVCVEHGEFEYEFFENNTIYVDMNTALRDIAYAIYCIENTNENTLHVMYDGSDWGGFWDSRIQAEALFLLNQSSKPIRIFSPLILDEWGGKLSKSLYIKDSSYFNNNKELIDFDELIQKYGWSIMQKIMNETDSWVQHPEKFFRNYTVKYIKKVIMEE